LSLSYVLHLSTGNNNTNTVIDADRPGVYPASCIMGSEVLAWGKAVGTWR